jgi:glycosyltransferase involved in cell wall biosynthesis
VAEAICTYEGPYPYIDGLLFRVTSSFSQIDIKHRERLKGRSSYTFWKSFTVWSYLITNFSIIPLRLASLIGIISACLGMVLGAIFFFERIHHPDNPAGWASLIVSLLTFGGLQLISVGIVGEYVGRVYLNINRRPQYVVGDTTDKNA